jgi:phage terminase large subunit
MPILKPSRDLIDSAVAAWIEEAQTLSHRSLSLLRPTIRTKGSQLWANWNPRRKSDAIDDFLRAKKPDNAAVVQANWRDNPWFLDEERRLDLEIYPERYRHIREGDYASAFEGAYFAKALELARQQAVEVASCHKAAPRRSA